MLVKKNSEKKIQMFKKFCYPGNYSKHEKQQVRIPYTLVSPASYLFLPVYTCFKIILLVDV